MHDLQPAIQRGTKMYGHVWKQQLGDGLTASRIHPGQGWSPVPGDIAQQSSVDRGDSGFVQCFQDE